MYSMEPFKPTGKEIPFADGRFLLSHRLGGGSFGDIYEGYDTERHERVAVKLEKKKIRFPQLQYESKIYRALFQPIVDKEELQAMSCAESSSAQAMSSLFDARRHTVVGVPRVYFYGSEGDYNIIVLELCGPSLEDLFNYCHRRFSLKTVLMIADQIIHRMQFIHDKGFVHRDVKPENFIFGVGLKAHILYVIDFGLSKLYWDINKNVHMPFAEGKSLTGTTRYCSANTHRGYEQSRRDDLESIGFLFVYFLKGSLPWQGIQARDQQLKTIRIGEKKIATPLEELCKGMPSAFLKYSRYCRDLNFQERPDYNYLRRLFRDLGRRCGFARGERGQDSPSTYNASNVNSWGNNDTSESRATIGTGPVAQKSATPTTDAERAAVAEMSGKPAAPSALGAAAVDGDGNVTRTDSVHPAPPPPATLPIFIHDELDTEAETSYGFYDWDFDWLQKRRMELNGGMPAFTRKNIIDKRSAADSTQGPTSDANQSK